MRAFDLESADAAGFVDIAGSSHEANINALAAANITVGCSQDPLSYCPNRPVSRAQMATFIARALALLESRSPTPDVTQEPVEFPGQGVDVIAGRADWYSGYFQGELYKQPSAYITQMRPGDSVYWMGVENILDDSNPANQVYGEDHSQRGADGTGGFAAISEDQCPSAADQPDGKCPIGWLGADIQVTANNDFLAANPAARALFEAVRLSVIAVTSSGASAPPTWPPSGSPTAATWSTSGSPRREPQGPASRRSGGHRAQQPPSLNGLLSAGGKRSGSNG